MAKKDNIKESLEEDVKSLIPIQAQVLELEQSPEVVKYLQTVDMYKTREAVIRKTIQDQMEANDIKSIKGDWGYMTIVERVNFKTDDIDNVPSKFVKKALDTSKVAAQLKLSGALPKGVTTNPSRSLTIKLNKPGE